MPEIRTYSVQEASQLTGISKPALRAYTNRTEYRHLLSTYATPDKKGIERRFTESDLHLLAFIYAHTRPSVGETHEQVAERLAAGDLEQFTWRPPEPQEEPTAGSTALVPVESLRLAQALATEAQRREQESKKEAERRVQEAQARADALQAEVQRLTGELGRAEGKLEVYEQQAQQAQPVPRKRPKWLISLFGE